MTRYTVSEPGDWELVDGSGDKRIRGHAHPTAAGADHIFHDIRIESGRDWGYSDDVWAEATVFHVLLAREPLEGLHGALRSWLGLSLADMATSVFAYSADLSQVKSSSVVLSFGPREDLILGAGQTGCHLAIVVGSFSLETKFVMNPTDLEGFAQGLGTVLSGRADS